MLKRLCSRVLPPEFDQQRKQGFSIPLAWWLRSEPGLGYFREVLLESDNAFFSRKAVSALLDGQAKGRANSERLFALVMFELWRREYRVTM
jgi:asparagine synthase (glutamine-hydrolysing)